MQSFGSFWKEIGRLFSHHLFALKKEAIRERERERERED